MRAVSDMAKKKVVLKADACEEGYPDLNPTLLEGSGKNVEASR
jgi:hypothetical protein